MSEAAIDKAQSYNEALYDEMWSRMAFHGPENMPWYPALKALADAAPERLEIGPGVLPRLPVVGTHVVDLSQGCLDVLARHGAVPHHGLLQDIKFDEGRFDLVGLFEVLEHVPDDEGLLKEIARITKPGGHLALTVPMGMKHYCSFDRYMGHVRRFEPEELRGKIERAGYVLERFEVHEQSVHEPVATLYVAVMKHFPRFTAWMLRYVFLPMLAKKKIVWHDAGEWDALTRGATDCGVVFRRVAGAEAPR